MTAEKTNSQADGPPSLRDVYAQKALSQIPRLLTLQDRNPLSPSYGSFHRRYWLDKTDDFPDALPQFGVQTLALVYANDFPRNPYYRRAKVRDWAIAGMDFWTRIQHKDGAFDEFYPYERGWAGPTAFTTYAVAEAYRILKDEIPEDVTERVLRAVHLAARSIGRGREAGGILANHHAVAALAVWKTYELLGDPELRQGFDHVWRLFMRYHNGDEGWSLEYDGPDPGYLSATVSFLGKVYQTNQDPSILAVLKQSVEFCSYFAYPNGSYGGIVGSRSTLHFYPHGFEVLAGQIPLAAAVADQALRGLSEGRLVPPEIMADRYMVYRIPELLQAYLDYQPRPSPLPTLPHQQESLQRYFPKAGVYVAAQGRHYAVANLAKGGVTKIFDRKEGKLIVSDGGIIGRLRGGRAVTSQWISEGQERRVRDDGWDVSGSMVEVPAHKYFTPIKTIIFRAVLLMIGWSPRLSHLMKGSIRKKLMLGAKPAPVRFRRGFTLGAAEAKFVDEIHVTGAVRCTEMSVGDDFSVRYVPQSRYFQREELDTSRYRLSPDDLELLAQSRSVKITRTMRLDSDVPVGLTVEAVAPHKGSDSQAVHHESRSSEVYGIDYYHGRKAGRQLKYRLGRRTREVESAVRRHAGPSPDVILDVGTADGLMLAKLRETFGATRPIGLDLSRDLLRAEAKQGLSRIQGDALSLPVRSDRVDVVVATAVIEHVPDADRMLKECHRVLRAGGLLVVTTPDPLLERVSSSVGLLKEAQHQSTYTLKAMAKMMESCGFEVLQSYKFMLSPVGLPGELPLERALRWVRLDLLMANQLLVARKP